MTDLKPGTKIEYKSEPHEVVASSFSRSSQSKGFMTTRLRNMITGNVYEVVFRANDEIRGIEIEKKKVQFLYKQGENAFFMDNVSFEQFELPGSVLGDKIYFLTEGMAVDLIIYNDAPISVEISPKVVLIITDTEPGIKSATASDVKKQAVTETGYKLQVPSFVNIGDKIKVSTETGLYAERA
ncbi:elongation factor P [Candidatus Microgenomates bacterium]|nr:elongation factor P [Candidatus Microgenomates bacterium]